MLVAGDTFALAVVAGAFVALGSAFFTVAMADTGLAYSLTRLIGGAAFSLALVLVVIAGAELFTSNNLLVMAWASRRLATLRLLRNWVIVYVGNMVGGQRDRRAAVLHGACHLRPARRRGPNGLDCGEQGRTHLP